MRLFYPIFCIGFSPLLLAQETKITPTEELRTQVREWVETMRKIQQEENDWTRDKEVLSNYKEGLEKEMIDLKEQIASAKTRKEGGDQQSLDKVAERDRLATAQDELSSQVRVMEENFASKLPLLPEPFKKIAKISVGIESLQKNLQLAPDKQTEDANKRLTNITELLAEIEKFQQSVQIYSELHKDKEGSEYNMQVIYFGLGLAYAVNESSTFALAGRPTAEGWKFQECNDLAPQIQKLLVTATSDKDISFTNLPLIQP